jgi:PII-like signaling protein
VSDDCLKLTIYFGERDRVSWSQLAGHEREGFLADALGHIYAGHGLRASLVMRGTEGFGIKHHLHTDRLLTLSEDLPLVSVAVDTRARVEAALEEVERLRFDGLVTLERARMLTDQAGDEEPGTRLTDGTKLTVYVGRHERAGGQLAYEAIVDLLHRHEVSAAAVLMGVDGTAHGQRHRARFFATNQQVPMMVIAVSDGPRIESVLPELRAMLAQPLMTLERVTVCKREGELLSTPSPLPGRDESGLGIWQKLMVHSPEQARSDGQPLHHRLIRSLRAAGAAGATTLRGVWGYAPGEIPHGDSFWQLRRRLPILTVVVDTPERINQWFALVDEVTGDAGLVTSEIVPAFRATGPDVKRGGLRLARF